MNGGGRKVHLSPYCVCLAANDLPTAKEMPAGTRAAQTDGVETWWQEYLYAATASDIVTAERNLRLVIDADPTAQPPRLALGKLLMQRERTDEGAPLLAKLAEAGRAEAAFYLGVGTVL